MCIALHVLQKPVIAQGLYAKEVLPKQVMPVSKPQASLLCVGPFL